MKTFRFLICVAGTALLSALSANATPYAAEVTNNSGTIQFYLNEQPDSVVVTFEDHSTLTLPSPVVGLNSFALGTHTSYAIAVSKVGSGSPSQISVDTNAFNTWNTPRGIGINVNPTNGPLFGRIYLANSSTGAKGKGLYILNADQSIEAGGTAGLTRGVWQSSSSSPYRLSVASDGEVYVGDFTAAGAMVWQFDPDFILYTNQVLADLGVVAGTAAGIHGQIFGEPVVTGSIAGGNMVLWTADDCLYVDEAGSNTTLGFNTFAGDFNNVNSYTIGAGPLPWGNAPDLSVTLGLSSLGYPSYTLDIDVDIGSQTGNIYGMFYRAASYGAPCLQVFDPTGMNQLYDSLAVVGVGPDPFDYAFAVKVSPDERFVAVGLIYDDIVVMSLVDGVPQPSTVQTITNSPETEDLRGICWDAADNIYTVSSGQGLLRVFSLGLTTTAITGNDATGKNGTFSLAYATQSVSVSADEPLISQANTYGNPTNGTFTLTRTGSTNSPLTVYYSLGGTATNGSTYAASSANSVTFPAGASNVQVTITALTNVTDAATLTVVLNLSGSAGYSVAPPTSATMAIANTGPQEIGITSVAAPIMYRGISNDYASFVITRFGDTNAAAYTIPANAFSYGGTAKAGVDYLALAGAVTVNPGDQIETVLVSNPVVTGVYHGNETILVSLNANAPVPVVAGSATMTLVDNADPPAPVLWSDPLTSAADSVNWTLTFANTNLGSNTVPPIVIPNYPNYTAANPDPNQFPNGTALDDFDVEFGYNVTNDDVGYSPMMLLNGWTNALKMTVNKINNYVPIGTTGGGCSAGVNLYPAGLNFSGNYAFRFSMNLSEGTTYTTEYNTFGINHYGTNCNWFASDYSYGNSTTNSDGVWFWIDADVDGQSGINTYIQAAGPPLPNAGWALLQNVAALTAPYTNWFKHPPYNGYPSGVPNDGNGAAANEWADVEVKQVNGVITLSINKFPILVYTNATYANSGDIMFGYDDPFASVGNVAGDGASGAAVYYSNARVVQLTPPAVSGVSLASKTLTVNFTDSDTDDTAASFELLGSSTLTGTFAKVAATFSQSTSGAWQAVVTVPNGAVSEFYKVVRIN
jgi:hypothetical protein